MNHQIRRSIFIILALFIESSACNLGHTKQSNLDRALAAMPAETNFFAFTDWSLIKQYEAAEEVTGQSSLEQRTEVIWSTALGQATASCYACNNYLEHASLWGWDSMDLSWEAFSQPPDSSPVFVLKFGDHFDFAPVLAYFDDRGYTQGKYENVTIYSYPDQMPDPNWFAGEFSILNVALLKKENLLILSAKLENVQAALDAYQKRSPSLANDQDIQAAARRLGTVAAAYLLPASEMRFEPRWPDNLGVEEIAKLEELYGLGKFSPLHAYQTFGLGYRYEAEEPLGMIVMHYSNSDDAQADLDLRRRGAEEGQSFLYAMPYQEAAFTLKEASIEGNDLLFMVRPHDGMPKWLFEMLLARDMSFANCPY